MYGLNLAVYLPHSIVGVAIIGLVVIPPACGYVNVPSASRIVTIASVFSYYCIQLRNRLKIDESLDVWACHGMSGTWGALATGIFANKAINPVGADGLIYGNWQLFQVQLLSVLIAWVFSFVMTYLIAMAIDKTRGLSVGISEEEVGLDISRHGEEVYAGL